MRRREQLAILLILVLAAPGCEANRGSVSGKVTLNGKPVAGVVMFVGADNKEASSPIVADGSYTIRNPPTGPVKVLVTAIPGMGAATANLPRGAPPVPPPPGGATTSTAGVPPPARYASATNGLTLDVTGSDQRYDIQLTP